MSIKKKIYKFATILTTIIFILSGLSLYGLEPFECALLINENSQDSLELANFYAKLRSIPDENVIYLNLPPTALNPPFRISSDQYFNTIRKPVLRAIKDRGLSDNIKAWVYSCGFPTQIGTADRAIMSLQGMTLCADNPPSLAEVKSASYRSPLYAGPGPDNDKLNPSRSFDRSIVGSDPNKPVPSMMLSFTGDHGMTVAESKNVLRLGRMADGSRPNGTVYFVKTEDAARSKPREWQLAPACDILQKAGVRALSVTNMPSGAKDVIGLQIGAKSPKPESIGKFRPGAMAEHLTSWGARFDVPWQTKATDWLKAGATASAGTVTEPFALWPKFPTAFFFYHYRSGCTIMESFFQSVCSPVQLLLLGEPLARPWIRIVKLTVISLKDGQESGNADFYARLMVPTGSRLTPSISFYLDGKLHTPKTRTAHCRIDTSPLTDGYHNLRAVAETDAPVNVRPAGSLTFIVNNRGRVPLLEGVSNGQAVQQNEVLYIKVSAEGNPIEVGVRSRDRVLAAGNGAKALLKLQTDITGAGSVPLQAFAKYSDGETTLSERIEIEVERRKVKEENQSVSINAEKTASE